MNNNSLIEIVRTHKLYLQFKFPRDEQVLEAMRRVDRREFLPDIYMDICNVDIKLISVMYKAILGLQYGFEKAGLLKLVKDLPQGFEIVQEGNQRDQTDADSETDTDHYIQSSLRNLPIAIAVMNTIANTGVEYKVAVRDLAYNDKPLSIGCDQTCSQPSLVGCMTDLLELKKGMKVLEVGAGCGYQAAIFSHMVGEEGKVFTLEYISQLADLAKSNLERHFGEGYENRVKVIHGDGSIGLEEEAPFDRVCLTAGVNLDSFDPSILVKQLNPNGGILEYPEHIGKLIKRTYKNNQMIDEQRFDGVRFVPLQGENS